MAAGGDCFPHSATQVDVTTHIGRLHALHTAMIAGARPGLVIRVEVGRAPATYAMTTSKRPTTSAQKQLSAQRAAAAQARLHAAQRRRQFQLVGAVVAAIVAIVAVLVVVKLASGSGSPKSGPSASVAVSAVTSGIGDVPAAAFDAVGAGSGLTPPKAISSPLPTVGGKPAILYIGAEFCPYCAAERWPVAVALARFGQWAGLGQTRSSSSDIYPSTATLSFHGAAFTGQYFSFTGKEIQSNTASGGTYAALDTLTASEQQVYQSFGGGYPFLDIGGRWLIHEASYNPGMLHGLSQEQIVAALQSPNSTVGRAILGTANLISAAICTQTNQQPAQVCSSPGVQAAAAKLTASG